MIKIKRKKYVKKNDWETGKPGKENLNESGDYPISTTVLKEKTGFKIFIKVDFGKT